MSLAAPPSLSPLASFWRRHAREILGLALLALVLHDIFGTHGLLAMRRTQNELGQLKSDIARLHQENDALATQVQSLKTDPKAIERVARDIGMAKPGETIFRLPPPDSASGTPDPQPAGAVLNPR